MEIDRLFGLPAHPLLVHLPVVLIPLAALAAVVMAVRPAWLDRFGWGLVILAGVGAAGAALAAGSGEALEEHVKRSAALERHADLGETARTVALVFFGVCLVVVVARWWVRSRRSERLAFVASRGGAAAIAVVLVIAAAAAMYTMVQVGHQGAKVTWEDVRSTGGG